MLRTAGSPLGDDFSVRLERAIESLEPLPEHEGIEQTRHSISEALHGTVLGQTPSATRGDIRPARTGRCAC
jgi:hypothetical protein